MSAAADRLTLVSLFDGIGGFPLAFERAGAEVVATVEIDAAASAVGRRHFPHAHQFTDVTKVTGDELRAAGFVPDRGVITFGWPCQDFSVAGRRAGLAGERSGLWWEVARILAEVGPRWIIGENVPGLLSSVCEPECPGGCMETHGGAMGAVLGSLGELGYGVAYRVLDAQYFGVPQQRRRVFIVGHLGTPFGAAAQVLLEPESGLGDSTKGGPAGAGVAGPTAGRATASGRDVAPALVARYGKGTDSDASDASDALIIDTHTHKNSSLDAAGRRETGSPDRRRVSSGRTSHCREAVAALTSNGVGTCGADDNQAQAGHIVVQQVPTDVEVYEWIKSHYGDHMPERLLSEHRRAMLGQGNGRFIQPDDASRGFSPADLDKILQTVRHARACIQAGHEPLIQPTTVTGGGDAHLDQ